MASALAWRAGRLVRRRVRPWLGGRGWRPCRRMRLRWRGRRRLRLRLGRGLRLRGVRRLRLRGVRRLRLRGVCWPRLRLRGVCWLRLRLRCVCLVRRRRVRRLRLSPVLRLRGVRRLRLRSGHWLRLRLGPWLWPWLDRRCGGLQFGRALSRPLWGGLLARYRTLREPGDSFVPSDRNRRVPRDRASTGATRRQRALRAGWSLPDVGTEQACRDGCRRNLRRRPPRCGGRLHPHGRLRCRRSWGRLGGEVDRCSRSARKQRSAACERGLTGNQSAARLSRGPTSAGSGSEGGRNASIVGSTIGAKRSSAPKAAAARRAHSILSNGSVCSGTNTLKRPSNNRLQTEHSSIPRPRVRVEAEKTSAAACHLPRPAQANRAEDDGHSP